MTTGSTKSKETFGFSSCSGQWKVNNRAAQLVARCTVGLKRKESLLYYFVLVMDYTTIV